MIKIRFRKPGRYQFVIDLEMPWVPRIGESIRLLPTPESPHTQTYQVHDIEWYPQDDDYTFDVYIVLA